MLPVLDILHRGIVYSLVGLSVLGVGMGVAVHRDTLQRGRGTSHRSR
jgi:Cytochrome oxidase c assembly